MPANIERIELWRDNIKGSEKKPSPVRIIFKFPCEWTILDLEDLKTILKLWIQGEEEIYPQGKTLGRWKLFKEIMQVFLNNGINKAKKNMP